jgi:hypothetical protein
MPRLYSLDPFPVVPNIHRPAVFPGEGYDFTDEQVAAGITGQWSETDPRAGLEAERAFKALRKAEPLLIAARAYLEATRPG